MHRLHNPILAVSLQRQYAFLRDVVMLAFGAYAYRVLLEQLEFFSFVIELTSDIACATGILLRIALGAVRIVRSIACAFEHSFEEWLDEWYRGCDDPNVALNCGPNCEVCCAEEDIARRSVRVDVL